MSIIRVAVPVPKRQSFDYRYQGEALLPGVRVRVPFGPRKLVGVVLGTAEHSNWQLDKLKAIEEVIDHEPIFSKIQLSLCLWLSQYYKHPIGEVMQCAMPVALRKGDSAQPKPLVYWSLSEQGQSANQEILGRSTKQAALFNRLKKAELSQTEVRSEFSASVIKGLADKELIIATEKLPRIKSDWLENLVIAEKPQANVEQAIAISAIEQKLGSYACYLLEGVTGSGKTEVYLQIIEPVLQQNKQVLILVPEIGLTPQTVHRFKQRFGLPVGVLHSGLSDKERLHVWQQSCSGQLAIVIGTRSAIFTPMLRPGLLIVDEEHDSSYKQQDGLRYHGRDLAVKRAYEENIPLILGTATPALETLNNAMSGKYQHLQLQQRAGNALHTKQHVFDIKNQPLSYGLAAGMIERIRMHLQQGSQVMLFVNRRGYAPALLCHTCGFVEQCLRCNKPFTLHKSAHKLQCHHCGSAKGIPRACGECKSTDLATQGVGTEQLEQGLDELFPEYQSMRVDSDSARGKDRLSKILQSINDNQAQILVGTQILSKGHHFPNVTLVIILDVDGALYSADYRAAEHLAQLVTQLAGRAGRADKPGEMWLQSHDPGHPLLQDLINNGYADFARYALLERQQAGLPPFSFQALFKAQASQAQLAHQFLQEVGNILAGHEQIAVIGPIPALMEKRQGQYRMQLLVQSSSRGQLQQLLNHYIKDIEALQLANKVRWALDMDPQDFS